MTIDEQLAIERLNDLESSDTENEIGHRQADEAVLDFLKAAGYHGLAEAYERCQRWFYYS